MPRKIIQIAFDVSGDVSTEGEYERYVSGSISSTMYALCDDGTIWTLE